MEGIPRCHAVLGPRRKVDIATAGLVGGIWFILGRRDDQEAASQ